MIRAGWISDKGSVISKEGWTLEWNVDVRVLEVQSGHFQEKKNDMDVFDGAFGGEGEKDVVMREGVVVTSSSLEMLRNSCLGGIMVILIFLEGLEEEALVKSMVGWFKEDEDDKKSEKDGLFN
ncbi:hypothetical protein Tco_0954244 [Tanacetum coccineum]|uniref:Uncharacterized protein n=1 Tax=Tanacetum coccineum TaxID=301880 RepID=A0ABQ5E319_9ASTR